MVNEGNIRTYVQYAQSHLPISINGVKLMYGVDINDSAVELTVSACIDNNDINATRHINFDEESLVAVGHDLVTTAHFMDAVLSLYSHLVGTMIKPAIQVLLKDDDLKEEIPDTSFDPFRDHKDAMHFIHIDDSDKPTYKCPYCGGVYLHENFFDLGRKTQKIWCDVCKNLVRLELNDGLVVPQE